MPDPINHTSPSTASTPGSTAEPATKSFAYVLCSRRKVRCDRLIPACSSCIKANVECAYVMPAPPRRRKKGTKPNNDGDLLARLEQYEEMLKSMGVRLDGRGMNADDIAMHFSSGEAHVGGMSRLTLQKDKDNLGTGPPPQGMEYGKIVEDKGNTRYLANELYVKIHGELDKNDFEEVSGDDDDYDIGWNSFEYSDPADLMLRSQRPSINLQALHPSPVVIFQLWQKFLENVNPCCKIIHGPTAQQTILQAAGNLDRVSKSTEALMFAVYCSAITSLGEDECEKITREAKAALLARLHFAVQQALTNAGLLKTSDTTVLQAFVLFLVSIFRQYDPRSYWALTGRALRIGQRIGLHRDGSALGLSVFQSEMRRRLWWEIIMQDVRASELCGSGNSIHVWDCRMPLNVDDSNLTPSMQTPPTEHAGPTKMMFVLLRCEIGEWLRKHSPSSVYNGAWIGLISQSRNVEEKTRSIEELEEVLERKFFSRADTSIPLHLLALIVGKSALLKTRFLSHIRSQGADPGLASTPFAGAQEIRDTAFCAALQMAEYQSMMQATPAMEKFSWLTLRFFQWHPFIFLLEELRRRTQGDEVCRAWKEVGAAYGLHPEIITQTKRALHVAVGNVTLKAWEALESANGRLAGVMAGSGEGRTPRYIEELRARRRRGGVRSEGGGAGVEQFDSLTRQNVPTTSTQATSSTAEYTPQSTDDSFQGAFDLGDTNSYSATLSNPSASQFAFDASTTSSVPLDWNEWQNLMQDFQSETLDGLDMDLELGI